ncbi:hypothetical protein F4827_003442 [Paraburkholderia bannensis]|uniref:Uncharacterized protein n=1 Tax=Paraburkholderia bannensis TaxID=765414 RepID=A0A7W9WTQ3_9BURK|nr:MULTISPECIES: hypothetical protein [Paraburkholderia]MBB3258574.1 hypothetical protein [Paraburkholderia sp. WP4_3_2]MBB6103587.1 hypothetical protein [Paraburkholderia bannensis]
MASLLPHHLASTLRIAPRATRMARAQQSKPVRHVTVQMAVRVATRDAQLARCLLHGLLGRALGVHTIDFDRSRDLACLHVELERARVPDAMALLIRTLPGAEFGTIRRLDRSRQR